MRVVTAVVAVLLLVPPAWAGHELTFYPSFYPQEITIRWVEPRAAAPLLVKNALHAYAGADPFPAGAPEKVRYAESLRGWVVLTFKRPAGDAAARCAAGTALVGALGARAPFVVHPWPVTPYHDDYVQQYDLAQRARERTAGTLPRVRAAGPLARALADAGVPVADGADAAIEEISLPSLLDGVETRMAPPNTASGTVQSPIVPSAISRFSFQEADPAVQRVARQHEHEDDALQHEH